MENFYLICPIGLENALMKEIQLKGLAQRLSKLVPKKGGIEVECELKAGLALNYQLRGATRILLRVRERKCRDFPKLFKTIGQINWRDYLVKEEVEWRITGHKSRIIHTEKAKKACEDALEKYFKGQPLARSVKEKGKGSPTQKVFLRFDNDLLTISLDTSGDLLHIRGNRPDRGKASLRENYASLLLTTLIGADHCETLVDPMCGTGTFLYEALDYYRPIEKKDFPFLRWQKVELPQREDHTEKSLVNKAVGFDLEPKAPERPSLVVKKRDFFAPLSEEEKALMDNSFLICNLPYGKRVKIKGERKSYFTKVIRALKENYRPKKFGIIVPADIDLPLKKAAAFNNNGIKVYFYIFEARTSA